MKFAQWVGLPRLFKGGVVCAWDFLLLFRTVAERGKAGTFLRNFSIDEQNGVNILVQLPELLQT